MLRKMMMDDKTTNQFTPDCYSQSKPKSEKVLKHIKCMNYQECKNMLHSQGNHHRLCWECGKKNVPISYKIVF